MMAGVPRLRRALCLVLVATLVAGGCSDSGADDQGESEPGPTTTGAEGVAAVLPALDRLQVVAGGDRPHIVDADGREVLLRGANLNALGDYHQADPDLPPVQPPTEADWDGMAAAGFDVVRLLVSWSALEPERGQIDEAYLQRIHDAVDTAAARRIHTVIDMHQDAWGKSIATPPGTTCPEGTEVAIGWDGAPEWATLTDGAETCRPPGSREGAPAVHAAFTAFYEDRDGIRTAFAATWRRLAEEFADEPAVAGFDLLNEPNMVLSPEETEARYTEMLTDVITQVRAGEQDGGGFPHIIFLEPVVLFPLPGTLPTDGFTDDDQIAFAPHNYAEVIAPILTVEQTMDIGAGAARERGWAFWVGEHGVFQTDEEALSIARRFAAAQDGALAGGAWWQWRQRCGDPHSIGVPGSEPAATIIQLNTVSCPDDTNGGPLPELMSIAGRAYPRRAPGQLTELASDPDAGTLHVAGEGVDDADAPLELWVPGDDEPEVTGDGIGAVTASPVDGGWIVEVEVTDTSYAVEVE
jgi:hypothetical protein